MSADDSELARLLDAARHADLPDTARLAAVRGRLLPPTAAGHSAPQPSARFNAVGRPSLLAAKIAVMAALALAAAGAFTYRHPPMSMQHELTRPATQTIAPAPEASPPASAPYETVAPTPTPTPMPRTPKRKPRAAEPAIAQPSATATPTIAQGSTLNAEASLLRLATLALRAGRLGEARTNLALFAQRYPNSQLNAERQRLERRARELEANQPGAWTVKPAP